MLFSYKKEKADPYYGAADETEYNPQVKLSMFYRDNLIVFPVMRIQTMCICLWGPDTIKKPDANSAQSILTIIAFGRLRKMRIHIILHGFVTLDPDCKYFKNVKITNKIK